MDQLKQPEHPLSLLLRAAGWQASTSSGLSHTEMAERISAALSSIGTNSDQMPVFQQLVANALLKSNFRMPEQGQRTKPKEILAALKTIESGLRQIEGGLGVLARARATAGRNSEARTENVANIHAVALGAIANAVRLAMPPSAWATDDQLAEAMPEYARLEFYDPWRGRFAGAAAQVQRAREVYATSDFRLSTRPANDALDELIRDLGGIYHEATGKRPAAQDSKGNLNPNWRSKFAMFVEAIWPLTGEPSAPSNKEIRGALKRTARLPSAP